MAQLQLKFEEGSQSLYILKEKKMKLRNFSRLNNK